MTNAFLFTKFLQSYLRKDILQSYGNYLFSLFNRHCLVMCRYRHFTVICRFYSKQWASSYSSESFFSPMMSTYFFKQFFMFITSFLLIFIFTPRCWISLLTGVHSLCLRFCCTVYIRYTVRTFSSFPWSCVELLDTVTFPLSCDLSI
jgi:hypothetical protein